MDPLEQHVFVALYGRRSVRRYQADRPVEPEKITRLLQGAMAAPSACNIQPWEFVVVSEAETVQRIRQSIPQHGDYDAPLVIVVCGCAELIPWADDDGRVDCSAATENLLLAATAMGLGSVWIGGFDAAAIREILDIPEAVSVNAVVYLGYPAEQPEPRTQYLESAVHWQRYDRARGRQRRPGSLV
jgi:nitroreductase